MPDNAPLAKGLLTSTLWREDPATRCLWIALLLLSDEHGTVIEDDHAIAKEANITIPECRAGLAILARPDSDSRRKDRSGARIYREGDKWVIVNAKVYFERAHGPLPRTRTVTRDRLLESFNSGAPDEIEITDEHRRIAEAVGLDVGVEWLCCRDYRRARNYQCGNWGAEFSSWLRRSAQKVRQKGTVVRGGDPKPKHPFDGYDCSSAAGREAIERYREELRKWQLRHPNG